MNILVETKKSVRGLSVPFYQTLTLTKLVPLSPRGGGNIIGEWITPSIFLGRTTKGTYFVRDNYPRTKFFPAGIPMGIFFDDLSTPFMVLYNFLPLNMGSGSDGMLIRGTTMNSDGSFGVKWIKTK